MKYENEKEHNINEQKKKTYLLDLFGLTEHSYESVLYNPHMKDIEK